MLWNCASVIILISGCFANIYLHNVPTEDPNEYIFGGMAAGSSETLF